MVRLLALIAVLAVGLAACVGTRIPAGSPEAYVEGWGHGCDTGYAEAGRGTHLFAGYKDGARYGEDPEYTEGWDAGYEHCFEEERRTPWMGGGPTGPAI